MEASKRTLYFRSAAILLVVLLLAGYFWFLSYNATVNMAIPPSETNRVNLINNAELVPAARGDITDRYGRVLVTNKTEYVVELDVDFMGDTDRQYQVVSRLIQICKEQGLKWRDDEFPVSKDAPFTYTTDHPFLYFDGNGIMKPTQLKKLTKQEEWEWASNNLSAEGLMKNLRDYFQMPASLSDSEAREILGVLYSAYLRHGVDQVVWTDYFLVEDVDIDFISVVKEENLPGVNIKATTVRQYNTDYAAVLLGQTGAISAEKWEELKKNPDYNMNDIIGLSGVEAAFEQYLKGKDGTLLTSYDMDGNMVNQEYTEKPEAGSTVALTLDIGLQQACEEALADHTNEINSGMGGSAAVVIDIHNGEVLAAASYPTFSAASYLKDYKKLAEDDMKPLYNRALLGTYAPGSTYKICTATAAYNAGAVDIYSTIHCSGSLKYGNWTYNCWKHSGHGSEQLSDAIRDSCNVYFYTVGSKIGIDKETKTARAYGLGEHSGIELAESTGVNAGPEYSESIGATWYPGNVLSASIGQSDNQFTPLQLANYIATFVNGGTRYRAHLLKSVRSSDNSATLYEYEDTVDDPVIGTVKLNSAAREAIVKGMGQVLEADDITDFEELEASGIKIGCKTGTAELGKTGRYNGLFVSFAPLDDPQIAICTVVEKAKSGASTASITADIMNYYFSEEAAAERVEAENALLH